MIGGNSSSGNNEIRISGKEVHIHGGINQNSRNDYQVSSSDDEHVAHKKRTLIVSTFLTPERSIFIGSAVFLSTSVADLSSVISENPMSVPSPLVEAFHMVAAPILILSALLLAAGFCLKWRTQSLSLSFLGILERGGDNTLYITRVSAICPLCGGKMRVVGASERMKEHALICCRNPNHHVDLDMTKLPDVAAEFAARRGAND